MPHGLSKTRLMSFRQCPKKLWLEKHRPELAEEDPARQAIFDLGHEVGAMAIAETERLIREAIEFHLEGLRADGTPIPPPSSRVDYVEVAA